MNPSEKPVHTEEYCGHRFKFYRLRLPVTAESPVNPIEYWSWTENDYAVRGYCSSLEEAIKRAKFNIDAENRIKGHLNER